MSLFHEDLGIMLYSRPPKPRKNGKTMVIDVGWPISYVRDALRAYGDYIDIVKINDVHFTQPASVVREKVEIYRSYGVECEPGGLIPEIAILQEKQRQVVERLAKHYNFDAIEISMTTLDTKNIQKTRELSDFCKGLGFVVYGEVGKKFFGEGRDVTRKAQGHLDVDETINQMKAYLDIGASAVFWEGAVLRQVLGNTAQELAEKDKEAFPSVQKIVDTVGVDSIIFEVSSLIPFASRRALQFWFVKKFGPNVNIGNAKLDEIPLLEHTRRGTWPVFGFPGDLGDHPWINALEEGKVSSPHDDRWWRDMNR